MSAGSVSATDQGLPRTPWSSSVGGGGERSHASFRGRRQEGIPPAHGTSGPALGAQGKPKSRILDLTSDGLPDPSIDPCPLRCVRNTFSPQASGMPSGETRAGPFPEAHATRAPMDLCQLR